MPENRIKELREQRGLSQEELGARVGTNKFKISRLETGQTKLDLDMAVKIARELGVSLGDVVAVTDVAGFAEDAGPYEPELSDPLHGLADASRNRSLYIIKSNVLDAIGIKQGDVLQFDISAKAVDDVQPLDVVLVQLYSSSEMLDATTLVRQFVPPELLITNSNTSNATPLNMSSADAHIKGVCVARHSRSIPGRLF